LVQDFSQWMETYSGDCGEDCRLDAAAAEVAIEELQMILADEIGEKKTSRFERAFAELVN
jgi:hypothetical protein